jgi:nicotinamidase-related amidase
MAVNLTIEATLLRDIGARATEGAARRAGHGPDMQILDADGVEAARHISGGLFHPVAPAICFAGAQPGNGALGSYAPLRIASRPGQTLLQPQQSFGFTSTKARNTQQLPGRQRRRYRDAAIDANHAAIIGSRDGLGDGSKSDVPAPRPIPSDAIRLHRVGDVAGPPEPNPTDLRDPYLPIVATQPLEVARFESDLPKPLVPAGLVPRRATVSAVEKVAHRLGEVPQCLLLHRLRPGRQPIVFGAGRSQLSTLVVVIGCVAARLPVLLLLDGQIPHKPGMATMLGQYCRLLGIRKQSKPAHSGNITATTDNLSTKDAVSAIAAKARRLDGTNLMTDPYTRPLPGSAALVLIDVQRDFYADDAPFPIEGTATAIPAMARLANEFRDRALPIVHVVRLYRPDGSNADIVRKLAIEQGARIAVPGSKGSQIAAELLPNPVELEHDLLLSGELQQVGRREHVMYKPRWGAFYQTKLEQHLRDTGSDTVVFAGCNYPNCPRTSIYEASERDFRTVLVSDAVSGLDDRGIKECRAIGVDVANLSMTLAWLRQE